MARGIEGKGQLVLRQPVRVGSGLSGDKADACHLVPKVGFAI